MDNCAFRNFPSALLSSHLILGRPVDVLDRERLEYYLAWLQCQPDLFERARQSRRSLSGIIAPAETELIEGQIQMQIEYSGDTSLIDNIAPRVERQQHTELSHGYAADIDPAAQSPPEASADRLRAGGRPLVRLQRITRAKLGRLQFGTGTLRHY